MGVRVRKHTLRVSFNGSNGLIRHEVRDDNDLSVLPSVFLFKSRIKLSSGVRDRQDLSCGLNASLQDEAPCQKADTLTRFRFLIVLQIFSVAQGPIKPIVD